MALTTCLGHALCAPSIAIADETVVESGASALKVDAELRFRGLRGRALDAVDPLHTDTHRGWFQRSRLGVRLERPDFSGYVQLQSASQFGASSPGADPLPLGLQQGWMRARLPVGTDCHIEAGRIALEFGAGRQIGRYDFDLVGQAFDGARLHFGLERRLQADAFVAQLRRVASQPDQQRALTGLHVSATPHDVLQAELYFLYLNDETSTEITHLLTMGSRLVIQPTPLWDLELESAVQTGEMRKREAKAAQDHLAWMAAGTTQLHIPARTALDLGLFGHVFSGDADPTDAVRRAWRPLYPSRDLVVGMLRLFDTTNLLQYGARIAADLAPMRERGGVRREVAATGLPLRFEVDGRFSQSMSEDTLPGLGGSTLANQSGWAALGAEVDLRVRWTIARHSELMAAGATYVPSDVVRADRGLRTAFALLLQWTTAL